MDSRNVHRDSGFTLVELLVVIAIIAILATLVTPVINSAREKAYKTTTVNNLKNIATACVAYSDDDKRHIFPWSKPIQGTNFGTLSNDDDARECLALLYKGDYVDDPKVFISTAASVDQAAEHIPDLKERKDTFRLEELNCSYTYRNKITTVNSGSRTPVSGDKRGGNQEITNHKDGRHVAYKGTQVEFFKNEELEDPNNRDTKEARNELIGFKDISTN